MVEVDIQELRRWIGTESVRSDVISEQVCARIAGTLGKSLKPVTGDVLPIPWHWLFWLPVPDARKTGIDGHPQRGEFLPPVPLPRRMWAASQVDLHSPIRVGEKLECKSCVTDVYEKQSRGGMLIFVKVAHEVLRAKECVLTDIQTIVYRDHPAGARLESEVHEAPRQARWSKTIRPDPVLLFRYSALMFNAHRIHYDRNYAVEEEGYSGLVIQGPLIASLLLDLLQDKQSDRRITSFNYRALHPLFDQSPFVICGRIEENIAHLWAQNEAGGLAASIEATTSKD